MLPGTAPAQPDWSARIAADAPGLRACLVEAGPAAFAIDAHATPDGLRVTLRAGGATQHCLVRDGMVAAREVLPGAVPPDPAATAFFLERRCVDARRIDSPDGTVLGWLAYPAC